ARRSRDPLPGHDLRRHQLDGDPPDRACPDPGGRMRALLASLRKLILGETWTIPIGVGAALALAVGLRASLPGTEWRPVGGFGRAVLGLAPWASSLRHPGRPDG